MIQWNIDGWFRVDLPIESGDLMVHLIGCNGIHSSITRGKWWFIGGLMGFNQQNGDFNGMYPSGNLLHSYLKMAHRNS